MKVVQFEDKVFINYKTFYLLGFTIKHYLILVFVTLVSYLKEIKWKTKVMVEFNSLLVVS